MNECEMEMESCFYSGDAHKCPRKVLAGWSWERGQENGGVGDRFQRLESQTETRPGGEVVRAGYSKEGAMEKREGDS